MLGEAPRADTGTVVPMAATVHWVVTSPQPCWSMRWYSGALANGTPQWSLNGAHGPLVHWEPRPPSAVVIASVRNMLMSDSVRFERENYDSSLLRTLSTFFGFVHAN